MNAAFGTDGIRGPFTEDLFSHQQLFTMGNAIAQWLLENNKKRVIIIHDTRISCHFIKAALKCGLLMTPLHIIDCGIAPTPAAIVLMRHFNADCTLVISASHNEAHDNGIKIVVPEGKLQSFDEERLSALLMQQPLLSYGHPGTEEYCSNATHIYADAILNRFAEPFLKNSTIVLDMAHGATFLSAPYIFQKLGARVISLHDTPNGTNINDRSGSLYPERLQQKVLECHADIGFAFDGDGDRVIAVSKDGVIKNGDDLLYILLHHPRYCSLSTIVSTTMSNSALEEALSVLNKKLIRTDVGDKYVMKKLQEERLLLGGEQSGHIILYDYSPIGDGIVVALTILETVLKNHNIELHTFAPFPQLLLNIAVRAKKDLSVDSIKNAIHEAQQAIKPGRLIIRYSGTELLLRIMAEAPHFEQAEVISSLLAKKLSAYLEL